MRLDNERSSSNIEDRRSDSGGGFNFPGGGGFPGGMGGRQINIPMGNGRGGMSISTIVLLVIVYFAAKMIFGIDLLDMMNGGGGGIQLPGQTTEEQIQLPRQADQQAQNLPGGTGDANVESDAGKQFVSKVLGSTERVWGGIFQQAGKQYSEPTLVLFNGFVQSACGMAQSAMGPFYCPNDQKVYIDLSFYQDMKTKLGAPGDFAQAYVIAHEVGHHIQKLRGIADQVQRARMRASEADSNALSVRMELQADCYAGVWAAEADATKHILEQGDVEEALNAASQIGDDRLQKKSQGYAVPETFTHGSSEQRVRWFKTGMAAKSLDDCDTFQTDNL